MHRAPEVRLAYQIPQIETHFHQHFNSLHFSPFVITKGEKYLIGFDFLNFIEESVNSVGTGSEHRKSDENSIAS
jgi:hypothetical protein